MILTVLPISTAPLQNIHCGAFSGASFFKKNYPQMQRLFGGGAQGVASKEVNMVTQQ
ncbi:hypothetical protein MHTCC0001_37110 [Flavobacteriaceae bacterium MHTCC 0001]